MKKVVIFIDTKIEFLNSNNEKAFNIIQLNNSCIKDYINQIFISDNHNFDPKLNLDYALVLEKDTFGYIDWKQHLNNFDEIDICGFYTDNSVISNALIIKTIFPNKKIKIIESCCAGTTFDNHTSAIKVLKSCNIDIEYENIPIKERIESILTNLQVPVKLKGYKYIAEAITIMYNNDNIKFTKDIYPVIAKKYNDTPIRVERSIRFAIENTFKNNPNLDFYGYNFSKRRPKVSDFLTIIVKKGL